MTTTCQAMMGRYIIQGTLWLCLYLALTLAPLLIVLVGATQPKREFWRELSVALGFIGLSMMGLQFVLTARFKWLKPPYGSDIVYSFHRQISLVAFIFILAHPLLLSLVDWPAVRIRFDFINHPFYPRFGFYALLALTLLIVTSLLRQQLKLGYDWWRRVPSKFAPSRPSRCPAVSLSPSDPRYLVIRPRRNRLNCYGLRCSSGFSFKTARLSNFLRGFSISSPASRTLIRPPETLASKASMTFVPDDLSNFLLIPTARMTFRSPSTFR